MKKEETIKEGDYMKGKIRIPDVRVEPLGKEWIVRVYFNDGYTHPDQLKGYYKTQQAAEDKKRRFLDNYMGLPLEIKQNIELKYIAVKDTHKCHYCETDCNCHTPECTHCDQLKEFWHEEDDNI
ncbi:MAG TPA: hypothetical protein VK705_07015 [Ferruginibacter sp.]|jgi:hypothetical protein|nr:hypothetical protein [Ferruginibacter sp.]